jgi:hypothetical protein
MPPGTVVVASGLPPTIAAEAGPADPMTPARAAVVKMALKAAPTNMRINISARILLVQQCHAAGGISLGRLTIHASWALATSPLFTEKRTGQALSQH